MNILLLVIDSLRAASLGTADDPRTPFFDELSRRWHTFTRAYATECWTLPSHMSMFTGLLPSQHGAHFQTMGYFGEPLTLAEHLTKAGYATEIVTRNPVFDPMMPGVLRGIQRRTSLLAPFPRFSPAPLLLALTKPRLRRQVRETGFFHPNQAANARFVMDFARRLLPGDALSLDYLLDRLTDLRRDHSRYFLFCNLFDVHAPYCPTEESLLEPTQSVQSLRRNATALQALALTGRHQYLEEGFEMPPKGRDLLLKRYHRAIELMDERLERFFREAEPLLGDTLVILCGDHGESFGEHGLYLHDASVFDINLRVPLWIRHPAASVESTDDVVSLRSLFDVMMRAVVGPDVRGTILDPEYRARNPVVLAEHFYYPRLPRMKAQYRKNLAAAISRRSKLVTRGMEWEHYDLLTDPCEERAESRGSMTLGLPSKDHSIARCATASLEAFRQRFGCGHTSDTRKLDLGGLQ